MTTSSTSAVHGTERATPPATNRELMRRALAAYIRAGNWEDMRMPAASVEVHDSLRYVVLRGHDGLVEGAILAVYRVLPSGQLKALRRYPSAIAGNVSTMADLVRKASEVQA